MATLSFKIADSELADEPSRTAVSYKERHTQRFIKVVKQFKAYIRGERPRRGEVLLSYCDGKECVAKWISVNDEVLKDEAFVSTLIPKDK